MRFQASWTYVRPNFKSVSLGPLIKQVFEVSTISAEPKTSNGAARRRRGAVVNFMLTAVSAVVSGEWLMMGVGVWSD
jgi:hypothetical protein